MTSLKRILAFSGLTGLLGALAFAAPASANVKAVCVVDGQAKAHTTKPVFKKYVQLVGGHGTYRFESVAVVCVDVGKGKVPGTIHTGRVAATGTFKKKILVKDLPTENPIPVPCGWGKVTGRIESQTLGLKFRVIEAKKFAIQFGPPYGTGLFFWHHPGPPPKNIGSQLKVFRSSREGESPKPGPKPYRFAGVVQLGPPQDKLEDLEKRTQSSDKCTKAFRVTGVIVVHEGDTA
ncbi:MAG: hypothetical protein M3141_00635 [Actinomycetota bacterium]|nr:hypothetical protein [Actinomycetota bacterium]